MVDTGGGMDAEVEVGGSVVDVVVSGEENEAVFMT